MAFGILQTSCLKCCTVVTVNTKAGPKQWICPKCGHDNRPKREEPKGSSPQ